mgnify:CR=1 FL=1
MNRMYPEFFVAPMRAELVDLGFEELRTPEAVDQAVQSSTGTVMVVVNSVCGCAAGKARPGIALALRHGARGYFEEEVIRQVEARVKRDDPQASFDAARERDAANDYLSHFRVRRLEAEAIRDALLAVSGRLDATQFGPPVGIGDRARRSIYLNIRRNNLSPFLETFDAPKPFTTLSISAPGGVREYT